MTLAKLPFSGRGTPVKNAMKQITVRYAESQEKNPRRTFQEELDRLETRLQESTPAENVIDAFERLLSGAGGELS